MLSTIWDLLNAQHVNGSSTKDEITSAINLADVVLQMDASARDTLRACFERGPVEDGSVPSKAGWDDLLQAGLVAKVVVNGEEGYNACTYLGASAYRVLQILSMKHPIASQQAYRG